MRPGPFAPHERPRKKYTARSYSRSTLRPPNRYSASPPRTAVTIMSIESSSSGREGFHDHRRPLAAPDASGAQSEPQLAPSQGVKQVDGDARAGRSERMADRDRAKTRSEEHTSELQSRSDLVCRLLLEKKKKRNREYIRTEDNNYEIHDKTNIE